MFYHRSTEGSQYHRRLCVEKIEFPTDGLINEVKMTSNGAGNAFSLGETVPAWRACEVEGGAHICGETLKMPNGSSALFRYVHWTKPPLDFQIDCVGSGTLEVLATGKPLSEVTAGTYEIQLQCHGELVVRSVTFE